MKKPLPVIVAALIWILIALLCVAVMEIGRVRASEPDKTFAVESFPDVLDMPNITGRQAQCGGMLYRDWIRFAEPVDHRPFLVRLAFSLRPWGEVGTDKGKARLDEEGAEVAAAYKDDEKPSPADLVPKSMGIGIAGRADF